MTDPILWLLIAVTALLGLVIAAQAGLRAWRGWLDLRRFELETNHDPSYSGSRIELADLKERVRKLEAIAAGVDL
jgi:hypothetical protein